MFLQIKNKILTTLIGVILLSVIVLAILLYLFLNSGAYHLAHYEKSPDGKQVGLIVANIGGGTLGWCEDLIYKFPSKMLIQIDAEAKNEPYLVKTTDCGETENNLSWMWE